MLIKNPDIVLRPVHGSAFLIDITSNYAGDKCALFEINQTGKFLWEQLDENASISALTNALQAAIIDEVPYEILLNDVTEYVEDLMEKHFIWEVSENG